MGCMLLDRGVYAFDEKQTLPKVRRPSGKVRRGMSLVMYLR